MPHLKWTFPDCVPGLHYIGAPPLITASGPLLQFADANSLGFIPLHGEQDEEHQFGVTVPFPGWVFDADLQTFRTNVTNFSITTTSASRIFSSPLPSDGPGYPRLETHPAFAATSPAAARFISLTPTKLLKAGGAITGGLTDFSLPEGLSPLDHDQRNTLNLGGDVTLPWRSYASTNIYYGSGFVNAFPGQALPGRLPFRTHDL